MSAAPVDWPVNLIVELHVREGEAEAFAAMFRREFFARSRTEPGCQFYDLWVSREDAHRMAIVERWASQAYLDQHLAEPWFAGWAPQMVAALRTPLAVRFLADA